MGAKAPQYPPDEQRPGKSSSLERYGKNALPKESEDARGKNGLPPSPKGGVKPPKK